MHIFGVAIASKVGGAFKSGTLMATLMVYTFQILPPSPDASPLEKGATNITLLSIVGFLLWWINRSEARQRESDAKQRDEDRKTLEEERVRSSTVALLVKDNITAMVGVQAASVAQKEATERLVLAMNHVALHQGDTEAKIIDLERREKERRGRT